MAKRLQNHLYKVLPEHDNHELLYRVAFSIARHLQVLEKFKEAEEELTTALHHCFCHREEITQKLRLIDWSNTADKAEGEDLEERQKFTLFNTTVVVANIGRIDVQRGHLKEAIPQLQIARTLLLDSGDLAMRGYVDFLLGSIYRQLGAPTLRADSAMPDPKYLLESAVELFQEAGHRQLQARARLELAQHTYGIAVQCNDLLQCRDLLRQAETLLDEKPSSESTKADGIPKNVERWDAQRYILLARIERAREDLGDTKGVHLRTARKHATNALKQAKRVGLKALEVIAGLVLAEVYLDEDKYQDAIECCIRVESLNPVDTADKGWLFVTSAHAFMKYGNLSAAESYLRKWRAIEQQVENVHVRNKAEKIEYALEEAEIFHVRPAVHGLSFEKHVERLQDFLVHAAEKTGGTPAQQANMLGWTLNVLRDRRNKMTKRGVLPPAHR